LNYIYGKKLVVDSVGSSGIQYSFKESWGNIWFNMLNGFFGNSSKMWHVMLSDLDNIDR
jgi:hypothetical protein